VNFFVWEQMSEVGTRSGVVHACVVVWQMGNGKGLLLGCLVFPYFLRDLSVQVDAALLLNAYLC
jgi:hypothetical protein